VFRFALGGIKFGDRPTTAAPSEGTSVDIGTVTPEEGSLAPIVQSDGSVTMLRITDIRPCEKNPRHAASPLFDTIKASIRQRGMDAPLKVTRRPGAAHYVVAVGGNTRLLAQLQLGRRPPTLASRRCRWSSRRGVRRVMSSPVT